MAIKTQQAKIKAIVDGFVVDNSTDYSRMDAAVTKATGLRLDNKSLWALVNRAKGTTERVSFTLED
jgi:hypothetical protein